MEEQADAGDVSSTATHFDRLQEEDASIWALLRILLSVSTLPHVVLIVALSSALQFAAVSNLESLSAMGFVSLSGGYFLTGLFADRPTVQGWIRLAERPDDDRSVFSRLLASFRICLFPLVMAAVVFVLLILLFGEQGSVVDLTSVLPWMLSSCFVIWAIVQGRGFGRWLSSVAASKLPPAADRAAGLGLTSAVVVYAVVMLVTVQLIYAFEMLADSGTSYFEAVVGNMAFFALVSVVFAVAWRRSKTVRLSASSRTDFQRFSQRWMALSQLMITWHLLTVWRHQYIMPGATVLFLEEFLLMMFTVLMAIWGLTSRTFRSPLKLVSVDNALPMGIAFGYAYAGSVAMLTTVLNDIQAVMMAGHLVVALTFLWMQPRVLTRIMGQTEAEEHIKRVVDDVVIASGTSALETDVAAEMPSEQEPATPIEQQAEGQQNALPEHPAREADGIGEEIEWKEPDVLAAEVEWDDEIELLD